MEAKKLAKDIGILVGVALVFVMVLVIISQFGYTLRENTTHLNTTIILPAANSSVAVGTTGLYPFLQDVTNCKNDSATVQPFAPGNYTWKEGSADGGRLFTAEFMTTGWATEHVNCTITYKADTSASDVADDFSTAITLFAGLFGIVVIALVAKAIIGMFKENKKE